MANFTVGQSKYKVEVDMPLMIMKAYFNTEGEADYFKRKINVYPYKYFVREQNPNWKYTVPTWKEVKDITTAEVATLPECDLCDDDTLAEYDARVPLFGVWANVCHFHFVGNDCELGLGKGQKLIVKKEIL